MYLERLIHRLRVAPCIYAWQRANVERNIKLTQMQIGIRKRNEKRKTNSNSWNYIRNNKVIMKYLYIAMLGIWVIGLVGIVLAFIYAEVHEDEEEYR